MIEFDVFCNRMKRIGVDLEFGGNYPWIYIDKINGNKVKEKFQSEHGFVVAYYPRKIGEKFKLKHKEELIELIRKYK